MWKNSCLIFSFFLCMASSINPVLYSQIPDSPADLENYRLYSSTGLPSTIFMEPESPGPEHVFVVYNINSSYGDSIASYYQAARKIPQSNICAIACDTAEVISREYYNIYIRDVLRDSLIQRGIREEIRFIVLTKGIPLKITGTGSLDMSSTDSELCLLFNNEYSFNYRTNNPYFGEIYHFESFTYPSYSSSKISYLVSRLDAFTIDDVISMIDRGVNPDTTGTAWYILDDQPGLTYDKMFEAKRILDELGQNAVYDNTTGKITQNDQGDVMGYCGHGIHASAGYPFILNDLNIQLANGALFNTYESYNGYSFQPEGRASNHNLVSDFIAIGGTGGIGHVYEPYSSAIPHENILFARYASGFTLIEAAYMSMFYISWTNVVVGDPLCRIKSEIPVYEFAPFTKIAQGDIVNDGGNSTACAWGDYDNDGYQDLFVANDGETNFLYRNDGDGSFSRVLNGAISTDAGESSDCTWGDYDNDGHLDLYVSNDGRNYLYKNDGTGNFNRIYSGDAVTDNERSFSSTWIDLNSDGYIDLFDFFSNGQGYCFPYYNNEEFLNRDIEKPLDFQFATYINGFTLGDYDADGDLDLFLANMISSGHNKNDLYLNNGDNSFSIVQLAPLTTDIARSYGANWIDYDQDKDLDLFVTNGYQSNNYFYLNNGNGTFNAIITGVIPNDCGESRGSTWIDFDNDGDLDLFVADSGHNSLLYSNNGDGSYTKLLATDIGLSTSGSWADYDNDGDLDLFVTNNGNNFLYRNDHSGNNWIQIKLKGIISNAVAIGAKVQIKAIINGLSVWQSQEIKSQHGYGTHNSLVAHFGLADANIVDSIIVVWPSGDISHMANLEVNQIQTISEPETPKIAFSADKTYFQSIPVTVQFTDLSVGDISSWKWCFGTGDSSIIKNPQYTFNDFGEYDITLITSNGTQSDTLKKRKNIIVDQFIRTTNIGISSQSRSSRCNWMDYNSDGWPDIYTGNQLYRNMGDGSFKQIDNSIIVTDPTGGGDASWADYDKDGDEDLFIVTAEPDQSNYLYRNNGDETFTKITEGAIVNDMASCYSCSWIDYDNDGLLDLFTANDLGLNFLYRGIGNGSFEKVESGDIVTQYHESDTQGWSDYDNDGDLDVFIGNPFAEEDSYFYQNNGEGTFTRDPKMKHKANICTWGDYNNDGFSDIFITDWPTNILFKNNGDGSFSQTNSIPTGDESGRTASWADFNNDGFIDLVVGDFQGGTSYDDFNTVLYKNRGDGTFSMIEHWQINSDRNQSTGLGWADYDNDGDLDIFFGGNLWEGNVLYNNSGNKNKWLKIKCTGVLSNRDAIGARLKIVTQSNGASLRQYREISAKTGYRGQNSLVVHFGLGAAEIVDSLIIFWPSGLKWDTTNVTANQFLKIKEQVFDPPPVISSLPVISFNEDDSFVQLISEWYPFVADSSDSDSILNFGVSGGEYLSFIQNDSSFVFKGEENWFGRDTLRLLVRDRSTTASADLFFNVLSINDPPIITYRLPNSISFPADSSARLNLWIYTSDPDQADSLLQYSFPVENNFDSLLVDYSESTGFLELRSKPGFEGDIRMFVRVEDDSGAVALDSIMVTVEPALGLGEGLATKIPDKYLLEQNYPNPFNPVTHIKFGLPKAGQVKIEIYSSLGQRLETLLNKTLKAGYHEVEFNADNLSSGVYYYRITADEFQDVKKMILLK